MTKRDEILSGVTEGADPRPYCWIPARVPRCRRTRCRRERRCLAPEPPKYVLASHFHCPLATWEEYRRWHSRLCRANKTRYDQLWSTATAILEAARAEMRRRGA